MRKIQIRLACAGVLVAAAAMLMAQTGIIGFGVKDAELKSGLAEAFISGYLPIYPNGKLYHAATSTAQVTFVKALLGAAKAYTATAAFKAEYAKHRESAKPQAPEAKGSADQQMNEQQAAQKKQLAEARAQAAKMPPEMQKQMLQMLDAMEAQLKKQTTDPNQAAGMKQVYEAQAKADQEKYEKDQAKWTADYPADSSALIAKRLKEFLDLTASVDFDAKLESIEGGRTLFAHPDYESKSSNWKLCFRAGREPVAAARAFVTDWLAQLGGK